MSTALQPAFPKCVFRQSHLHAVILILPLLFLGHLRLVQECKGSVRSAWGICSAKAPKVVVKRAKEDDARPKTYGAIERKQNQQAGVKMEDIPNNANDQPVSMPDDFVLAIATSSARHPLIKASRGHRQVCNSNFILLLWLLWTMRAHEHVERIHWLDGSMTSGCVPYAGHTHLPCH